MIKYISLFFIFIQVVSIQAQGIHFEHYGEKDGLSQNSIRKIIQDDHGFLWIATFGGVNRFDGYDFNVYEDESEISQYFEANDIVDMAIDTSNNLWVGTTYGLTKYHLPTGASKTYFFNENDPNGIIGNEIRSVYLDKSNRIWIGTKFNGICYYVEEDDSFHPIKEEGVVNIREIKQTQGGRYWYSTFNKGVFSFEISENNEVVNKITHRLTDGVNTIVPEIYFLFEDDKFDLFAGTKKGMFKLNKLKKEFELLPQENQQDYFRCITKGPNDFYWIGTLNGLIKCKNIEDLSTGIYERYNAKNTELHSLSNNYILSLLFDKSGVLWIGTENGMDKYDAYDNQFKFISRNFADTSSFPNISCFSKTIDGKLLVGTHSKGIYLFGNGKFEQILPEYSNVISVYTDDNKLFYIGLWTGGIIKYNYITKNKEVIDVGFKEVPILSYYHLDENNFLIGSNGEGLIMYNFNSGESKFVNQDILGDFVINKIVKDSNEFFWIATENGVCKLDLNTDEVKVYALENNKISNNRIKDIVIDDEGVIWAATRGGLNYYDPDSDTFKTKIKNTNLLKNWVTDIAIDSCGVMWLNMNYNQLGKYDRIEEKFKLYHVNNGIRSNIENKKGFLFFNDSIIYMGGDRELIYFSPSNLKENRISPLPIISEFKIQNKLVLPGSEINGRIILEEDLNYSKKVDLSYDNRNFSVKFSVPSYLKERNNKFQFMLEGFEDEWQTANGRSRTIQYANLFPGNYILKIRASNSDGVWSEESQYKIRINLPFWFTPQVIILFLLLISVIIYFIRKAVKNRLRLKQELITEKVNRERDIKLNNEKLRFFTNISHELRTPLTLILGPAKQLLEECENETDYQKSRYNLIHKNALRLFNLVNQVLDFRKAQSGELKLKVSKTDILSYTQNIFDSFKELAFNKEIKLTFDHQDSSILGWVDKDKYDKILYNLLSNAIKFTNRYGNIGLFVYLKASSKDYIVIEVIDDGIGIPLKSQDKIFERFYQATNSQENNTGSGIGLSLVKSLIELHKGTIKLHSEPGKGSSFTIEIPIDKSYYDTDEVFEVVKEQPGIESVKITTPKKIIHNTELKNKILVVEDNTELRKYLVDYLSNYYKVFEAENGEEGLKVCRQVKPILCVADVMMPVKDGLEFCKELKSDEFMSHIPVVLLTALSANEDKVKGYEVGADSYLVKPFDPSLLKTVISNVIKTRLELKTKFSNEVESEINSITHSPIDEEFMLGITNLIEANLSELDLTTAFLCEKLGMSSSKLYRKIKGLTDLAPNEFIRTIRLKKSAVLLKTKKYNVSEVTTLCGFNDPYYFSRCFKKQFGFPPSKLLK